MRDGSLLGFTNATDAADYMVKKGLPFREAHRVIGSMVLYCIEHGCSLSDLDLNTLKEFSPCFEEDFYQAISLETCINSRTTPGGPAPDSVLASVQQARRILSALISKP